jgi:protein gp37
MRGGKSEWTGKVRTLDRHLQDPLHWKKPRRVFVCHMGDLFHEDVPWNFIYKAFETMLHCPQHTFMVLTKRAWRLKEINDIWLHLGRNYPGATLPLSNVWGGVTVEDSTYRPRIMALLETHFAKRFVSAEPLLESLDLEKNISGYVFIKPMAFLDLVIAGCESGPRRRFADTGWFRDLRDQCHAAGVPYFLKQMDVNGKLVKMPALDGVVYDQMPKI